MAYIIERIYRTRTRTCSGTNSLALA